MATAEQVKALLESHVDGDEQRFYTVAIQIAAHAARRGHGKLAEQIRELVDQAKLKAEQETKPALIAAPKGSKISRLASSPSATPSWG